MVAYFPRLPQLEDGQALGATTLNLYTRGLQWLLGQSLMTYSATRSRTNLRYQDSWGALWDSWGFMYYPRIRMRAYIGTQDSSYYARFRLRYFGDDGNWHDVWTLDTTAYWGTNQVDIIIDLSGETHMTQNNWYHWVMEARTDDEQTNCVFQPTVIGLEPEVVGWVAMPDWIEDTVSSAANFNSIRHNAYALYNYTPKYHVFSRSKAITNVMDGMWITTTQLGIQKRGDDLLVGMQIASLGNHQWRVRLEDELGNVTEPFTSAMIGPTPGEYPLRTEEIQLPGDKGQFFRIYFETKSHSSTFHILTRRPFALFEPDLSGWGDSEVLNEDFTTPAVLGAAFSFEGRFDTLVVGDVVHCSPAPGRYFRATVTSVSYLGPYPLYSATLNEGTSIDFYEDEVISVGRISDWPPLEDWEHGDTDVGRHRLLNFNLALDALRDGNDEIFGLVPFEGGLVWVSGDMVDFVGPHRYRWLIYYNDGSVDRPAVHYGPNFEYSHDLPQEPLDTMVSYDMTQITRLRPGMTISVSGVQFAAESDRVLT